MTSRDRMERRLQAKSGLRPFRVIANSLLSRTEHVWIRYARTLPEAVESAQKMTTESLVTITRVDAEARERMGRGDG